MSTILNQSKVCEQPLTEVLWSDKNYKCELHFAEQTGKWTLGYHFTIEGCGEGCGGSGCLPCFNEYRTQYETMMAARKEGIARAIDFFKQKNLYHGFHCLELISMLEVENLPKQLSLFN